MKKITITLLALLLFGLAMVGNNNYMNVQATASSVAKGMCVLEGNTNTILYEQNAHAMLPMASTTKIVTAILAIEHFSDLEQEVSINDNAVGIEGTSIYLQKGEKLTVKELLYGLMLASVNDAALALAYAVSSSEQDFVDLMNEFAQKIGAVNTHFDNPHGLDSKTHYTTAYDLALITSYALKNQDFKEIVSTQFMQITGSNHSGERHLRNKNRLLFTQENNIGVKTGFTDNAGRCLVNAVDKDGMQLITVVLNCGPMFEEARRLTNLAFSEYIMKDFVMPYNYVGSIPVENGNKNEVNIVSIKGFKLPIKIDAENNYEVVYNFPDTIQAPINKDDQLGEVTVYYNGEVVYNDKLYSIDEVKNVDIKFMLNNIIENWF